MKLKVTDSIIIVLRELRQRVENLESRISVSESDLNKQDQYNRCNNLDIQRFPGRVESFQQIGVNINTDDIEDWYRLGKSNKNKSSVLPIGRIERQFWKKKIDLKKNWTVSS